MMAKDNPAPLSDEQLQQLKDAYANSTQEPWQGLVFDVSIRDENNPPLFMGEPLFEAHSEDHEYNVKFVVLAHNLMSALLAEVERQRAREAAAMKIVQEVANALPLNDRQLLEIIDKARAFLAESEGTDGN